MSDSDELIASDESESEAQFDSFSETTSSDLRRKSSPPNVDLTIEESGDESDANDDSLIVRKPKKRVAIIASDSEEDDEEEDVEQRALSPRTRMSMTGIRPADLSDDSSEIDYSDEEQGPQTKDEPSASLKGSSAANSFESAQAEQSNSVEEVESSNEEEEDGNETNSFLAKSADETSAQESSREARNKTKSFLSNSGEEESAHEASMAQEKDMSWAAADDSGEMEASSSATPLKSKQKLLPGTPENINSPLYAPRYSTAFASAIKEKLSSTICQTEPEQNPSRPESDDSDIVIVNKSREKTIEIFSSEEDEVSYVATLPAKPSPPTLKPKSELVQPKLFSAMPPPSASIKKTPKAKPVQYVSKDFYDKEVTKLATLKSEKLNAEALFEKVAKCLPDGGTQLKLRIQGLQRDVEIKESYIASLKVHDVGMEQTGAIKQHDSKPFFNKDAPNWDDLSNAVNEMKPVHTGKQGLATFNTQKALTVERLKEMHVSLEKRPGEDVLAEDPKGLKVKLMDHQKHALAWMAWREKQKPRGGILADDMGLGKTLTMISMVLAAKIRDEEGDENADPAEKDEESESDGEQEAGKPKTWSTKGRRDFYNGGTLVVCPASLIRQWEGEVESKLSRHKLTVCVHHGNNRDTKPKHLRTYDMVVTTYQIVAREHKSHGALYGIKWRRIILDEAHVVRNHKAQSSLAVCELKGRYRWALTGTPIQNKEMDVYAILKFLKCSPFDDLAHWKKWIDNKSAGGQMRLNTLIQSLMLRRTKQQLQARGELNCLPSKEIKLIEVELDKEEMNVYQKIMIYSRTLFAQFLMQRAERSTDLMYRDESVKPTFMQTKDPNDAYYKVHQKFTRMHQHSGREQIKSHQILVLLLRLRQICCHPGLIDAMLEDEEAQVESEGDSTQPDIDLLDQLNKLAIKDDSGNGNPLLGNSMEEEVMRPEEEVISKASARVLQRSNPVFDLRRPSTKMLKVLDTIKSCVLESNDKAIIVSQWTSVLNILRTHLEEQGIATLSLNGQIAVKNRQEIVTDFNNANSRKKVLLLSLTAGGVGLNLVGANHLLLIDLHWNPQLEAQAQDRIYRVGQKKDVFIYKFMCKDTVEARIRALQEHKLQIANGVLTGAKASAGTKLTIDDLKGLFGM